MRVDTALTAFSITTLTLIVGLVILTASSTGMAGIISGNYYLGIPSQGQVLRDKLPLTMVTADASSKSCYWDGVTECARMNAGENFVKCANSVALQCGARFSLLATCTLPPGFELKYNSDRECRYAAVDECKARCADAAAYSCVRISQSRCQLIGGKFQNEYLQSKYTSYGAVYG
ncbi:MAG: hypothetical protein QXM31_00825 [Candidatus Woesearchaeota archaeon]